MRPRMEVVGPVLDAPDAVALAGFYERLLGWRMVESEGPRPGYPPADGWAKLRSPNGDYKLEFQWEEHYRPPVWPPVDGEQQMMVHLDIAVDDLVPCPADRARISTAPVLPGCVLRLDERSQCAFVVRPCQE